jgi:hypothetical protein
MILFIIKKKINKNGITSQRKIKLKVQLPVNQTLKDKLKKKSILKKDKKNMTLASMPNW